MREKYRYSRHVVESPVLILRLVLSTLNKIRLRAVLEEVTRLTTLEAGHGPSPALSRMHLPTSLAYWKICSLYLDLVVGVTSIIGMTPFVPSTLTLRPEALIVTVKLVVTWLV